MKLFGILLLAVALSSVALTAAFGMAPTPPSTKPATATSQPAMPACCGDSCKKMGASCCKSDAQGKVTCSMGGSCCLKPSTAPAASMPGMGGMKMGN